MAKHNEIGKIGEKIAFSFLMKHGFSVLDQNYRTLYGEIDIVAKKDNIIHFVEVKSIEVGEYGLSNLAVLPEDNFTKKKEGTVRLSAELYMNHRGISQETRRQFDLACIYINQKTKEGRVKYISNV